MGLPSIQVFFARQGVACIINLFYSDNSRLRTRLACLSLSDTSQLTYACKAVLTLSINIRSEFGVFIVTNALAYYQKSSLIFVSSAGAYPSG